MEIRNNEEKKTVYSVWVKITLDAIGTSIADIELLSDTGERFISENLKDVNVNLEAVQIDGVDARGQPCKYLLIYRIKSLASEFFQIREIISPNLNRTKETKKITLTIMGVSDTAARIFRKENEVGFEIAPPENLTIKRISYLMKRKKEL